MIAITKYDATAEHVQDEVYGCSSRVVSPREPMATINLQVVASGADLDKFMAMLAIITGQQRPSPVARGASDEPLVLGTGLRR